MKTIFRPQFWIDVEDCVAYLARNASPEVACRWRDEVMGTTKRLEKQPDLGRLRRDLSPPDTRSLIIRRFPRYLLFYRCCDDTLEFLRIKHGMMDLPQLFAGS